MSVAQVFAINFSECVAPYLLLSFVFEMGPLGFVRRRLCRSQSKFVRWAVFFPARMVGASTIMFFVLGMFLSGNFAFLHPLSVVSLVASMGTVRGCPVHHQSGSAGRFLRKAKEVYRFIAAWCVLILLGFALLPSFRAYAWLCLGSENTGPFLEPLMSSYVVRAAEEMNLGIPYQRHEYFANPVHVRNEMVLFADAGKGWVELDIPNKVGRLDRSPRQTSPLHRRFAWRWCFLGLPALPFTKNAANNAWLGVFLEQLCRREKSAWASIELSPFHDSISEVKRVKVQLYSYHFAKPGSSSWWTRESLGDGWWSALEKTCASM